MGTYTATFTGDDLVMEAFTAQHAGTAIRFVVPDLAVRPIATTVELRAPEALADAFLAAYTSRYDVTVREQFRKDGTWAGAMDFHKEAELRENPVFDALLDHPDHVRGLIIYSEGGTVTLRAKAPTDGATASAAVIKGALEARDFRDVFIRDVDDRGVLQGWRSLMYAQAEPFADSA